MSLIKRRLPRGLKQILKTVRLQGRPARQIFTEIYAHNRWGGDASVSGPGSDFTQTQAVAAALPAVFKKLNIKSVLDIPCGDFNWMSRVDLGGVKYLGADIVPKIIESNRAKFPRVEFLVLNLIEDKLPPADLIFCRDCLVHFSFADIFKALKNIKAGGAGYLMTTTFTDRKSNADILTGDWRPLNLQIAPFNFPAPIMLVNEHCTENNGAYTDKSLGVWRVADLEI